MTDTDVMTADVLTSDAPTDGGTGTDTTGKETGTASRRRRAAGLNGMVLAELRALAAQVGIKGTSGMRKGDLIAAIASAQASRGANPSATPNDTQVDGRQTGERHNKTADTSHGTKGHQSSSSEVSPASAEPRTSDARQVPAQGEAVSDGTRSDATLTSKTHRASQQADDAAVATSRDQAVSATPESESANAPTSSDRQETPAHDDDRSGQRRRRERNSGNRENRDDRDSEKSVKSAHENNAKTSETTELSDNGAGNKSDNSKNDGNNRQRNRNNASQAGNAQGNNQNSNNQTGGTQNTNSQNGNQGHNDDDENGRGRRGRRFRDRRRGRDRNVGNDSGEPQVNDDDVLQPVAGILDVLDNYAFVRTSGYLAGTNDVYVSMNLVRKNGLRRGDAITGVVRVPKEGDNGNSRQKFNPLVRLDTVNGGDVEAARKRPDFNKLTPLYPNQRLRLETQPNILTTRVIDLVMPIGKGQRALISAPPKAGKTTIMQDIANAISVNNPECYLMVVLVDERPEEVTDMQRSVKGEVISSTFDRPPSDHTAVAELAIERAKRLVENGKDVVVLLDSITRLGRAYNNSSPASGRILSGGIDSTALYPPKRFLGAARNIENGGSLTIIATAMVETGSTGDTVIFEEFKGTGNAELKLDRKISERRVFPAVDINPSGTRKDELLLASDEAAIVHRLRRLLSGLDSQQAIDLLISQLKKTKNNVEFLMQAAKTTPQLQEDTTN